MAISIEKKRNQIKIYNLNLKTNLLIRLFHLVEIFSSAKISAVSMTVHIAESRRTFQQFFIGFPLHNKKSKFHLKNILTLFFPHVSTVGPPFKS